MHDIDSTQTEVASENENENEYETGSELSHENEYEAENEFEGEAENEFENESEYESEGPMAPAKAFDPLFNEADEMELAAELMEVSNEQEMEQFLGSLLKKAGGFLGKVVHSPIGKAIGGVLRNVAKVGLPIAGKALGTFFGGPVGGMLGGQLGSAVSGKLEMEAEMEAMEFESARRFVRTAGAALRHAARYRHRGNPHQIARRAVWGASRRHAPFLSSNFRRRRARRRYGGGAYGNFGRMRRRHMEGPENQGDAGGAPSAPSGRRPTPPEQWPQGIYPPPWVVRRWGPPPWAYGQDAGAADAPPSPDAGDEDIAADPPPAEGGHGDAGGQEAEAEYFGPSTSRPLARAGRWYRRGKAVVFTL